MKKLNKKDLVLLVSEKAHLSLKESRNVVDIIFDEMEDTLLEDGDINITNFGVFSTLVRKERDGTDPKTHSRIVIKSKKTITFKPAKVLKVKLN